MSSEAPSRSEQVFVRSESAGSTGMVLILVGIGGLCLAALGFLVAVFGRVGQLSLHAMATFPTILSIAALTAGWSLLRTPRRVAVGTDGLTIETKQGTRHL